MRQGNLKNQGCGSGSVLDPDSVTLLIRIGNPDPGSRGKKVKKFLVEKRPFSYFVNKKFTTKKV
jgi:hypothetical protein